MPLTVKQVKTSLGRVKILYQRNEIKGSLEAINYVLENLSGPIPTDVRSVLREVVQIISHDTQIKKYAGEAIMYKPGSEKELLNQLRLIYQKIKEEDSKVSHQEKLDRKLNLDKLYNEGIKALSNNNATVADECFAQALTFYVDEHQIFYMIALALKEAGEIRRALPYAKRGFQAVPDSARFKLLLAEIAQARSLL